MELSEVVRRRRMVRSFSPQPVAPDVLDRVLRAGLSGPSAGFTQALELVVLEGPDETQRYWNAALPAERRGTFPWPSLLDAPVLVVLVTRPAAYVERYAERDKIHAGLGRGVDAWPTPYWHVDGGMAANLVLLAAVDEGLGALFFGLFEHEAEVFRSLGVPDDRTAIGAIALGYEAEEGSRPSRSAQRGRRPFDETVHRGSW